MDVPLIKKSLNTRWFARDFLYKQTTRSTNDDAKSYADLGASSGFTIMADSQTAGRGRYGRTWFSPVGCNIYFSTILRPSNKEKSFEIPSLTLVASVAIHETLLMYLPSDMLGIKWPNDIICNGKKLAGVLTELHHQSNHSPFLLLGIGVNINIDQFPDDLKRIATSLKIIKDETVSREEVFARLCEKLEKWYESWLSNGFITARDYWERCSGMVGKSITVTGEEEIAGMIIGLSETGGLLVENINGAIREIKSGAIELSGN